MRRRLTVLVAATVTLVLIAFSVPLGLLLRTVASDRAVSSAAQDAEALSAVVATADQDTVRASVDRMNAVTDHPVTVYWPDGTVIGADAPRSEAVELAATGRSITAEAPGGREILFGVQGLPEGTAVIRSYVADSELTEGVGRAWVILGVLVLALLAFGLLLADRLARVLLVPLAELSQVSHRLAGGDLEARARVSGPAELREVGAALNGLAGRIRDLLAAERERVADLSHRLRTPVTTLRLEAEALNDPRERETIESAANDVQRAVDAAINAARSPTRADPSCDAAEVVAERVEFWSVLAEETSRALEADPAPGPLPVQVSAEDLAAAMDALLGNVFAHTPDGTPFAVHLTARPEGGAVIEVSDEGPGMPAADRAELAQRGHSGGGSTGLGLDIVRRTAVASGGGTELGTGPGGTGTLITVTLG
ncbi:signal transduction histidine kinase [Lipingzhangella halophila]|uniref:histidine kinase n=1 Tax=Lipingzhangella halophila TaxID=1783352 RepID=A0A7W7RPN5_9ACTN|nr:HAMP domain-containing sensor histidine kinase [Lipingzhangella halophila]MBB4935333.1 signal transduction histidine kinase [Lipingzhangella halophila]